MKLRRYTTTQLLAVLLLLVLIPAATVTIAHAIQHPRKQDTSNTESKDAVPVTESCKGNHSSEWEFFESVATLPPVTILEIVDNRMNWAYAGSGGIKLGSLDLESSYTFIPTSGKFDRENHSGCYGVHFCKRHLVALKVDQINPKLCHSIKN